MRSMATCSLMWSRIPTTDNSPIAASRTNRAKAAGRQMGMVVAQALQGQASLLEEDQASLPLDDAGAEVPSPTFPIMQPYATPRLDVGHFDLYRLTEASELAEVGFEEALAGGAAAVGASASAPSPLLVRLEGLEPNSLYSGSYIGTLLEKLMDEAGDRGLSFARAAA